MNEPRDSPARRQQFLVICSVMAAAFAYTAMTSGIFMSVQATEGPFPGGNYCYKFAVRDYAASMGYGRRISEDWAWATLDAKEKGNVMKLEPEEKAQFKKLKKSLDGKLYHIYLDDTWKMGGTRLRFMSGLLVSDADKAEYCDVLMEKNEEIERHARKNQRIHQNDKTAGDIFSETLYEYVDLPSVDSLVVQFPFTDGFVSSLIFSYKILPAMRKMIVEKGGPDSIPVVISQCDRKQQMCSHYAPLVQSKDFLMGLPTTEEHLAALGPESFLDWEHLKGGARKILPGSLKEYIDKLP
ncbi:hypothetical protein IV203_001453 [Nitzschia inconspicua]|uniref:Uncharacterized protein n=1 Tax=Nitzschia inconspicua TaxID=303405 RepID=A0A9K3L723_9STRA|nr:hypothetical protein IV203_001453 [Nitzschia inconspicua]